MASWDAEGEGVIQAPGSAKLKRIAPNPGPHVSHDAKRAGAHEWAEFTTQAITYSSGSTRS